MSERSLSASEAEAASPAPAAAGALVDSETSDSEPEHAVAARTRPPEPTPSPAPEPTPAPRRRKRRRHRHAEPKAASPKPQHHHHHHHRAKSSFHKVPLAVRALENAGTAKTRADVLQRLAALAIQPNVDEAVLRDLVKRAGREHPVWAQVDPETVHAAVRITSVPPAAIAAAGGGGGGGAAGGGGARDTAAAIAALHSKIREALADKELEMHEIVEILPDLAGLIGTMRGLKTKQERLDAIMGVFETAARESPDPDAALAALERAEDVLSFAVDWVSDSKLLGAALDAIGGKVPKWCVCF